MRAGLRARRPAAEKDMATDSQPAVPPPTPMSEAGGLPGVLQDRQPAEALLHPAGYAARWAHRRLAASTCLSTRL